MEEVLNKITAHCIDSILVENIGKFNNDDTRILVREKIKRNIHGSPYYSFRGVEVICDLTNNDAKTINGNALSVSVVLSTINKIYKIHRTIEPSKNNGICGYEIN
jgi:hypothetical protein